MCRAGRGLHPALREAAAALSSSCFTGQCVPLAMMKNMTLLFCSMVQRPMWKAQWQRGGKWPDCSLPCSRLCSVACILQTRHGDPVSRIFETPVLKCFRLLVMCLSLHVTPRHAPEVSHPTFSFSPLTVVTSGPLLRRDFSRLTHESTSQHPGLAACCHRAG